MNTEVNRTTLPGVVVDTFELFTIVSTATSTVLAQRGSVPAAGQLLPGVAEVTAAERTLSPVSGLLTVTENVIVAVSPGFRFPVQVSTGLANDTVPAVVPVPVPVAVVVAASAP